MAEKQGPGVAQPCTLKQTARLAEGFYSGADQNSPLDLGASDEAPPAYGDHHDQLNLSQAGFNAGAVVTDDGRVNINISQTNRQLADILAPALRGQVLPSENATSQPFPPAYIPPSLGGMHGQTPPPKLNVVIQIVGSRGDVQPFVALGKVLKEAYGHRVRLATHPTFQKFVEENGLEFFSIGGDPAELMAFMVKNPGLMPGVDALKSGEIAKRRKGIEEIILGCWRSCIEAGDGLGPPPEPHQSGEPLTEGHYNLPGNPDSQPFVADAIIANPPSFAHIHIAEKMGIPLHIMFTMPWSPTKAFSHPLANIESSNTDVALTNYVSYALVEMMTWQGLGDVINRFRAKVLDLDPLSLIWAPGILSRLHIPTTYCWSPALIPKPNDWGREVNIPGFFFLDLATSYTPEPDLAAFLNSGPPPVYIGFGSIVVDDPNKLTRMIFDAVSMSGVRALVSKGWGGLGADSVGIPDGVFMLGNCPHDWLFKKVSCVVHHGGAGTTAAGIKTGTPTVVVPFFGDQPFWGSMIAKAGAGPPPIPYKKLTAESLAEAITTALKPETQARAKELGAKIRQEKGSDLGAKNFHDFLDYDKLRCSIAPSRAAAWQVKKTQVRLSTLAAEVVVQEGLLQYSDLKLYRPQEYDTEEQPWDPLSAVTSALVGDVGSMAMAIGDMSREWYKVSKKKSVSPDSARTPTNETASGSTHNLASSSRQSLPSDTLSLPSAADSASTLGRRSTSNSSIKGRKSPRPPASPTGHQRGSSQNKFDLEATLGASLETGKGVGRVVETGFRTPMNFCMGLAKGFRNVPKLYNDDTVRKQEKVTGIGSGLKVAGKEFGFGLYDGVTGLVTQPLKGAEKDGAGGLIKGFGKGIGGLMLKPVAGFWAIPAYAMKGIHEEVRAKFHKSVENYIVVSRILQGQADLRSASSQEKGDIASRFRSIKDSMYIIDKSKSKGKMVASGETTGDAIGPIPDEEPKTGFWQTRHLSLDERKRLHALKKAWKDKSNSGAAAGAHQNDSNSYGSSSQYAPSTSSLSTTPSLTSASTILSPATPSILEPDSDDMDRAIRESVAQTSNGDRDEDARIEAQIRASVYEMRRVAEANRRQQQQQQHMRDWKGSNSPAPVSALPPPSPSSPAVMAGGAAATVSDWGSSSTYSKGLEKGGLSNDISDEEYEALIAEAVRQSMMGEAPPQYQHHQQQQEEEQNERPPSFELHGISMVDNTMEDHANTNINANSKAPNIKDNTTTTYDKAYELAGHEEDEHLIQAIRESMKDSSSPHPPPPPQKSGIVHGGSGQSGGADDDNEELKRAMAESEREHREHLARASSERTEEEIIMEYVKKQSLAEEEYRQSRKTQAQGQVQQGSSSGGGAGGASSSGGGTGEEEELRRALEESLRMWGKNGESSS